MTKRLFLTGVTGAAGPEVLTELLRQGYDVSALVRNPSQIPGCHIIAGELSQPALFAAELEASDAIVHLASSRSIEEQDVLADVAASASMINRWKNGTFISISSGSLYRRSQMPVNEDMPVDLIDGYSFGKMCNEFQLRAAAGAGQRGPGISLRPGIFLGAGPRRNNRQLLGTLYDRCRSGAKFFFPSEEGLENFGSSLIGTRDFGRAVAAALTLPLAGVYNVAGCFCTWRQLIGLMNQCAGTRAETVVSATPPVAPNEHILPLSRCFLDTQKFDGAAKFAPQESLEQLIEDYVRAEREQPCR